jgi:hypothetical protein
MLKRVNTWVIVIKFFFRIEFRNFSNFILEDTIDHSLFPFKLDLSRLKNITKEATLFLAVLAVMTHF